MFGTEYGVCFHNQRTKSGFCAKMNQPRQIVRKAGKKPDRRIERTKKLLHEALTSLACERTYDSITVQDILDRANIGRSTFYTHFRDKDELLVSGFEEFRQLVEHHDRDIRRKTARPAQKYNPALFFFQHAAQHHRLYKSMIGSEIMQSYLYKLITQVGGRHIHELIPDHKKTPVPPRIITHFMASWFLALLTWWINHDLPYSPEEALEMYHRLALPGINAGLGHGK
jgi:AcrR family transcriptional regulator